MKNTNHNIAYDEYQKMNHYWLDSHSKLLYIGTLIGAIFEVIIMVVIFSYHQLSTDFLTYMFKYVLSPLATNLLLSIAGTLVVRSHKLTFKQKQYFLSILTLGLTFVFSCVHNLFVVIMVIQGLPILVTVVYEDEKLTTVTAILSILLIYISGCFVVYDLDKVVDYLYVLNMLVLLVAVFILWIISCYMIQFNEKKRKIIIQGDIERFDLQKRIYIDGLTLIGNKSAFDRHLDLIFDDEHNTYHLAMFDIDLFKNFNDQYGHLFGDRVLTCLGEILLMDMSDMQSYRYGGDEFCLIFKNMADSEVIDKIKTIQKRLKESIIMDKNVEITISVGVSKKDFELSKTEWINRADKALYKSKNTGRNKITFFRDV